MSFYYMLLEKGKTTAISYPMKANKRSVEKKGGPSVSRSIHELEGKERKVYEGDTKRKALLLAKVEEKKEVSSEACPARGEGINGKGTIQSELERRKKGGRTAVWFRL